jgi:hypothetical protein
VDPKIVSLQIEDMLLRSLAWVFVGLVFGFIFVVSGEVLHGVVGETWRMPLATVMASTLTSLVYGSMRLTVIVANVLLAVLVLYFAFDDQPGQLTLGRIMLVCAAIGTLVGGLYGWSETRSMVWCADAKIVAGLVAGLPAALLALVLGLFNLDVATAHPWLVAALAPVAAVFYVRRAAWFIGHCHRLLPRVGDGILVGLGVGVVTGLLFLVMAGIFGIDMGPELSAFFTHVDARLSATLLWSAGGCLLLGLARSFLRVPWYNL